MIGVHLSVCLSVCLMSRTSALTRKPKGLGRRNFAQGYPRSHTTPTPTSRSKGQKSRSRGGGILWRPPSRTACYIWNLTLWACDIGLWPSGNSLQAYQLVEISSFVLSVSCKKSAYIHSLLTDGNKCPVLFWTIVHRGKTFFKLSFLTCISCVFNK